MDRKITSMGERYAFPVLIRLYRKGGLLKYSDLSDIITTYSTLKDLMDSFETDGLVKLSRVTKPYKTNYVELTDLGYRVATKLAAADDILIGNVPEPETNHSNPKAGGRPVNLP